MDGPRRGTDCITEARWEGPGNRASQELRNAPTRARVGLALLPNLEEERTCESEVWVEYHTGIDIFITIA